MSRESTNLESSELQWTIYWNKPVSPSTKPAWRKLKSQNMRSASLSTYRPLRNMSLTCEGTNLIKLVLLSLHDCRIVSSAYIRKKYIRGFLIRLRSPWGFHDGFCRFSLIIHKVIFFSITSRLRESIFTARVRNLTRAAMRSIWWLRHIFNMRLFAFTT